MRALLVLWPTVLAVAACGGTSGHVARPATTRIPGAPHIDPYRANLAFARCMRMHGVAHPNPDRSGDFHLTPAQERAMRASATPREHEVAEQACFHLLKGVVSTTPLSAAARKAALAPLRDLKRCLEGYGSAVGKPTVRNLSRGRAMFGFDRAPPPPAAAKARDRLQGAQHSCEQRVKLAQRIDAIVKADRGEGD
jgi:hypothetical protein